MVGAFVKSNPKACFELDFLTGMTVCSRAVTHSRKNNLHHMFRKKHEDRIYLPWLVVVLLSMGIIQRALILSPQFEQL